MRHGLAYRSSDERAINMLMLQCFSADLLTALPESRHSQNGATDAPPNGGAFSFPTQRALPDPESPRHARRSPAAVKRRRSAFAPAGAARRHGGLCPAGP